MTSADVPDRRYVRTPATAPGPSGPQMLASYRRISGDPLRYLRDVRHRYGPVVQFPVPSPPTYLVDDAHLVRSVLMAYDRDFDKDTVQYRALSMVTGEGLLAARNERWRRQRPVVQPAFHRGAAERMAADAAAAGVRLVHRWSLAPSGSVVDVEAAMLRVGLEAVGAHLFGADLEGSAPTLARATQDALDAVIASVRPPWSALRGLPTPAQRTYRRAMRQLDGAVAELVSDREASPARRGREDLLALLLAAYPDDPRTIRDQIITFLVAGHETVASALTWTLGLLAHHPQEQERAQAQVDDVLGDGTPALADLDRLPCVRACFDEALRLYPPAWIITRSAERRMVLGGREIPQGSLVIISPWLRHRDPDRWPQPDAFRPQRFATPLVARAATTRAEYLPFGVGPRLCIGRDFALIEAGAVLAGLLRRFTFEPVAPGLPGADPLVTLRPAGGLRLRLHRRWV